MFPEREPILKLQLKLRSSPRSALKTDAVVGAFQKKVAYDRSRQ